ncbi:MAG: putative deacylase [Kiritimatiellia bacterium]
MSKKRESFEIAGGVISPGFRSTVELPIADLYTHTTVTMPVKVIHGRREGPVCFICAAIHGDEINGVDIIRRILTSKQLTGLRGTLICVPVVNVFGFSDNSRYMPDRRDLNRCFPGTGSGSMTSRLANTFMTEVVARSDYGLDLHTGSDHRANLPQIRACLDDPEVVRLAEAFAAPVIVNAPLREGSLRDAARATNTRVLVYETGEPLEFDELGIRTGVSGVLNVLRAIGMIAPRKKPRRGAASHVVRSTSWTRAPQSGILHTQIKLGQVVQEGDVIGIVADIFGEHRKEVIASASGIVIGLSTMPLVNEGAALIHIARTSEADLVAETVETLKEVVLDPAQIREEQLMDD